MWQRRAFHRDRMAPAQARQTSLLAMVMHDHGEACEAACGRFSLADELLFNIARELTKVNVSKMVSINKVIALKTLETVLYVP